MSLPFDATLKDLGRDAPRDVLAIFDRPTTLPVSLLNVDLSTVTTAADLVVGLGQPLEEIVHLDFQAGPSATKHADVLAYNALLHRHYLVPVHSIVVLLRPQASHANLNGAVRYAARPGRGKMEFSYEVFPLWEQPVADLLAANPGMLPLAVLGRLPEGAPLEEALTGVLQRLVHRLLQETTPERARKLLTSTFTLLGLRLPRDVAQRVLEGVQGMPVDMRESDTYLAIMDEGREAEAKKLILLQGQERFGAPEDAVRTRLQGITNLERLERLGVQLLRASSWQELLDTP